MELLNPKDIFKNRPALLASGDFFAKFLMYILRFDKLNKIYSQIAEKEGIDFIDELIKTLEFNIEFDESQLSKIPKKGPVITSYSIHYTKLYDIFQKISRLCQESAFQRDMVFLV